ncbi:MAG: MBL fold metallo-hydrolase [Sedimentisphaerales bacterium]|nr:MBL fold metallo-hydrolase [Sedimentisphaerales bacterium]
MSEIVILGSGAGFASMTRFNTSIALLAGDQTYILDCGEPCSALLYRNGIDPLSVKGIFISHMHTDHIGGLIQLLFSMYLPSRSKKAKHVSWSIQRLDPWYVKPLIYPSPEVRKKAAAQETKEKVTLAVPHEAVSAMKAFLPSVYLMDEVLPFELDIIPINVGSVYKDDTIELSAGANKHMAKIKLYQDLKQKYPYFNMESYCFPIQVDGKKVVYSGDIDSLEELSPLLPGADMLILEIAHIPPEDVFSYLKDRDVAKIVLTHIHPALEERLKKAYAQNADNRYLLAYDGLKLPL